MRIRCSNALARLLLPLLLAMAGPVRAEPVVEDAWLRAVPPVSSSTAGYLTLRNDGDEALCLTGVSAPFAGHAMLHSMALDEQGIRRMRHLSRISIEPGEAVTLAPGGVHLMLTDLERVPVEGTTETLCLSFAQHPPLCVPFAVQRAP